MPKHAPLTQAEKELIYRGKLQERTLTEVASTVGCSPACARKWWRRGRDHGRKGLQVGRAKTQRTGILSRFDTRITGKSLTHKRSHPRWGAVRVLIELGHDAELKGLRFPKRSRLSAFFKARCPECVAAHKPRKPAPARPPRATGVHEIWQLDFQEGIGLQDGDTAGICNIRDPLGAAMIASQALSVKTKLHWRKFTFAEVRTVLRGGFAEWQTLPDALWTDNEPLLHGWPTDPFPSMLTLWLRGLGVPHEFIRPHTPTDQPQIERNHLTLDGLALNEVDLANLMTMQQALDRERYIYNHEFPVQASDCGGRPPLVAHPELLRPRRLYQPKLELALFDMQRVYDYLATFTFERKITASGQVSLGHRLYAIGRVHAGKLVLVHLDAKKRQWVVLPKPADETAKEESVGEGSEQPEISKLPKPEDETAKQEGEELARFSPRGLDVQTLTGLDPADFQPAPPVQLSFPCFV